MKQATLLFLFIAAVFLTGSLASIDSPTPNHTAFATLGGFSLTFALLAAKNVLKASA